MNINLIIAIATGVISITTLVLNKYFERKTQQRNIKEEKYISFLSAFVSLKAGEPDASKKLNETLQVMNLIGSSDVVKATASFTALFMDDNPRTSKEKQDAIYSTLLKEMRKDLYKGNSNEGYPNQISLITSRYETPPLNIKIPATSLNAPILPTNL